MTGHVANGRQDWPLGAGRGGWELGRAWGAACTGHVPRALYKDASFSISFFCSFLLGLDIWFWTPLRALLDVSVRLKEASFPASLRHICYFSASRRMSGISPWVA